MHVRLASMMEQTMVRVRGRKLSWVDFGGVGPTVLALHGSYGRGAVFARSRIDCRERLGWWRWTSAAMALPITAGPSPGPSSWLTPLR